MKRIKSTVTNLKKYNLTNVSITLFLLLASGCQSVHNKLSSLAQDYNRYVEVRLATMQKEKRPYIHLELCTSGQAPKANVSYFIFRKDDKFYFEKTTLQSKYVEKQFPKEEYNKYFNIIRDQDDYSCFSDTTIDDLNTAITFYKVNTFDGKVNKEITLCDFQVSYDTTLPAVVFIRTFIFDRHWDEMKELYQKK